MGIQRLLDIKHPLTDSLVHFHSLIVFIIGILQTILTQSFREKNAFIESCRKINGVAFTFTVAFYFWLLYLGFIFLACCMLILGQIGHA